MTKTYSINISSKQLSELIGDIYDSVVTANWHQVLGKLANYTNANKAFCMLAKLGEQQPLLLEFNAKKVYPEQAYLDYQSRPFEDPFYDAIKEMSEGDAVYLNELIDINQHINSNFYQNIFKPLECHHAIGGILIRDGKHEGYFAVHRGANDLSFSNEDKNLIYLVTPHFRNAMQMFKDLKIYKQYTTITDAILEQTDKALLVCDAQCNVLKTNAVAIETIKEDVFVDVTQGRLSIAHTAYNQQLIQSIQHCTNLSFNNISAQQTIIIEHQNDIKAIITISPLRGKTDFVNIDKTCCLVSIEFVRVMPWQNIKQLFLLTPKELVLLQGFYQHKSLRTIAEELGTSYNTQRAHLQNIYKKIEVNSQTELMIKLNTFKQ